MNESDFEYFLRKAAHKIICPTRDDTSEYREMVAYALDLNLLREVTRGQYRLNERGYERISSETKLSNSHIPAKSVERTSFFSKDVWRGIVITLIGGSGLFLIALFIKYWFGVTTG